MTRFLLILPVGLFVVPTGALADKCDAWLNIFRIPGLVVDRVGDGRFHGQSRQTITGRVGSTNVGFSITRPGCSRGFGRTPVRCSSLSNFAKSIQVLERRFNVTGGRNWQHRNAPDDSVVTVWFEYEEGHCVGALAMLGKSGREYGTVVSARACCDEKNAILDHLVHLRSSSRERNIADEVATKVAVADGHYEPGRLLPLDPIEPWINVRSMYYTLVDSVHLATADGGRADTHVQIINTRIHDMPVRLAVRDLPCRDKESGPARCSKADIRGAVAAPDFFRDQLGVAERPTINRISAPKVYSFRFSFSRSGEACHGLYLGLARAKIVLPSASPLRAPHAVRQRRISSTIKKISRSRSASRRVIARDRSANPW
jgi:hypothetical protein